MGGFNKLWGTTRCGIFNGIHDDSDRFTWRRDQSCISTDGSTYINEVPNCANINKIELAAYAYDGGDIPY